MNDSAEMPEADPEDRAPLHGFQGNRAVPAPRRVDPLSVAISRESGARGGTIARRVGRKLGWSIYDQELLEYMAQDTVARQGILDNLPAATRERVEVRVQSLLREEAISQHPWVVDLARVVLALGAQGQVVLLGRGAGCILPAETTLNVRVIAPLAARVAYMSQWMRLSLEEAAERVRVRDERRAEFLMTWFHREPGEMHQYDLLLNSSLLGEELCAELIVHAVRSRSPLEGMRDE
jgi:cytidylate kinase